MPQQAVLTPAFGAQLQLAFSKLAPQFRLEAARIGPRHVDASICRGDGSCFAMHFSLRDQACMGEITGDWCLVFPAGPQADTGGLSQLLSSLQPDGAVEHDPSRPAESPWPAVLAMGFVVLVPLLFVLLWHRANRWARYTLGIAAAAVAALSLYLASDATPSLQSSAEGLALLVLRAEEKYPPTSLVLWFFVPLGLGIYLATCVRSANQGRLASRLSLVVACLVGPLMGLTACFLSDRLGGWDGLGMGVVLSVSLIALGHERLARGRLVVVSLLATLFALLLGEAVVRLVVPQPTAVASRDVRLLQPHSIRSDGLPATNSGVLMHAALYGVLGDESLAVLRFANPPAGGDWLLHLGDSMVFGAGVAPDESLPGQLAKLWQGPEQLNAGVPATSLDVQLAVAWRLLQPNPPGMVVLHVMPGNDLEELDQPNEACKDQPTLIMDPAPALRCSAPQWAERSSLDRLLRSRPPLPVALLTDTSWLARLAELASQQLALGHARQPISVADASARYERLLVALKSACANANVPLLAVTWPLRPQVYQQNAGPKRRALFDALESAEVETLDIQPLADEWVASGGEGDVYLTATPGDIHLNAAALDRVARWLLPQLQARWRLRAPGQSP